MLGNFDFRTGWKLLNKNSNKPLKLDIIKTLNFKDTDFAKNLWFTIRNLKKICLDRLKCIQIGENFGFTDDRLESNSRFRCGIWSNGKGNVVFGKDWSFLLNSFI